MHPGIDIAGIVHNAPFPKDFPEFCDCLRFDHDRYMRQPGRDFQTREKGTRPNVAKAWRPINRLFNGAPLCNLAFKGIVILFPAAIFLLLASAPDVGKPVELAQLTIEQRVIIRVPLLSPPRRRAPEPPPPPAQWREKKGPKCLDIRALRGASIVTPDGLDLILANQERYRAQLERTCRSIDFYAGFYIEPTEDGHLCASRDSLQARGGMSCQIAGFRRLIPDK